METEKDLEFQNPSEKQIVFLSQLMLSSQLRGISRNKLLKAIAERQHSVKSYSVVISYVLALLRFKEFFPEFFPRYHKKKNGN